MSSDLTNTAPGPGVTNVPPATPATDSNRAPEAKTPTFKDAFNLYSQGNTEAALLALDEMIEKNSTDANAYILRGTIYSDKQAWDQAEKDYQTVLQMDPRNDGVRYDLADLKFKAKRFDEARAAFVPLQNNHDSEIKDMIQYKIYICDLLGGHEEAAAKELEVFDQVGLHPSYYYGNVAWNIVHKKPDQARDWLNSAGRVYSDRKQAVYTAILDEMGYLPLPPKP